MQITRQSYTTHERDAEIELDQFLAQINRPTSNVLAELREMAL
ncbi:MAG TPA: hypothetical protein VF597_01975 [Candidatus Saccharimonadales bacterium]|jgi:hypothetical protein